MDKTEAKNQVVRAGRELLRAGLVVRTWGNVSCRPDDSCFVITASGRHYKTMTPDDIVEVKLSDLSYEGDAAPSSEYRLHRAVYRLKEQAGFVIHTHQDNASAVSASGADYIDTDEEHRAAGRRILCAEYGLPGTDELCRHVMKALEQSESSAVILKNHGALCFGETYKQAFEAALSLEEACGAYLKKLDPRIISRNKGDIMQKGRRIVWNRAGVLLDFAEEASVMRPYLDDFAQIAGMGLRVLPKDQKAAERAVGRGESVLVKGAGAFCTADTLQDARALALITEKNAMAWFAAKAAGGKPLDRQDCRKLRKNYLACYSGLAEKRPPRASRLK